LHEFTKVQTLNKLNLRYSIIVGIRYFPVNGIPTSKPSVTIFQEPAGWL